LYALPLSAAVAAAAAVVQLPPRLDGMKMFIDRPARSHALCLLLLLLLLPLLLLLLCAAAASP
jgi:hypothetical protein